jgi:hypothetical protein
MVAKRDSTVVLERAVALSHRDARAAKFARQSYEVCGEASASDRPQSGDCGKRKIQKLTT